MLLDKDSVEELFNILNRMYFNHLFVLFLLATLYVCSGTKKNKDYIMINNVEPKLMKGEIVCKV